MMDGWEQWTRGCRLSSTTTSVSQFHTWPAYALSDRLGDWKFKNDAFEKNPARIVTHINHQEPFIDYNKSFSPVMGLEHAPRAINDLGIMSLTLHQHALTVPSRRRPIWDSQMATPIPGRETRRGASLRFVANWEDMERGAGFTCGE
jgi:hypothetical protein